MSKTWTWLRGHIVFLVAWWSDKVAEPIRLQFAPVNVVLLSNEADQKEARDLVHRLHDRGEALHQALCLSSFGIAAGAFLGFFECVLSASDMVVRSIVAIPALACAFTFYLVVERFAQERANLIYQISSTD